VRYIDLDRILEHPDAAALVARGEEARQALLDEQDSARRMRLIAAQRSIWVEFRTIFEQVYGTTCWYTESHNPGTDNDVDHYRPKGRIFEAEGHGGYWWEALHWRNFRYSSHRANRLRGSSTNRTLGKGDHFPLLDESKRWRSPTEECYEEPKILDPTKPADPPMLTFDQDGLVALMPVHLDSLEAVERFEATRDILHLDAGEFVANRRSIFNKVLLHVLSGDRVIEQSRDPVARERLTEIAKNLIRLAEDNQPYSRAATCHICRFRDRNWVEQMVIPHLKMTHEP
jgi:hypothetical protein